MALVAVDAPLSAAARLWGLGVRPLHRGRTSVLLCSPTGVGKTFVAQALGLKACRHGRRGGRLDALFLDEGFGALDNPSLDLALDALESRAQGGRLVAVISHVRAVAERIPDVFAVVRSDIGATRVGWLSERGHNDLLDRDLAGATAGLLP